MFRSYFTAFCACLTFFSGFLVGDFVTSICSHIIIKECGINCSFFQFIFLSARTPQFYDFLLLSCRYARCARTPSVNSILRSIIANFIVPDMLWFTILLILAQNACCSVLIVIMFICFFLYLGFFPWVARVTLLFFMITARISFVFILEVPCFTKQGYLSLWDLWFSCVVFAKLAAIVKFHNMLTTIDIGVLKAPNDLSHALLTFSWFYSILYIDIAVLNARFALSHAFKFLNLSTMYIYHYFGDRRFNLTYSLTWSLSCHHYLFTFTDLSHQKFGSNKLIKIRCAKALSLNSLRWKITIDNQNLTNHLF